MSVSPKLKAICQFAYDFAFFVDADVGPTTNLRGCASTAQAPTLGSMKPTLSCAG